MRVVHEPRTTDQGLVEPAHMVEVCCDACGYDLDEAELDAEICSDCGQFLNLKQHVAIQVTTMPAASGGTMP